MDPDSGRIYRDLTAEDLAQLQAKNPRIVEVPARVADAVEIGMEALRRADALREARRLRAREHPEAERAGAARRRQEQRDATD